LEIRRIALRGLVAAPLVVIGGAAVLLWLPRLVREQVAARLQERSGLQAKVSDVSLGLASVSLGEVTLGSGADGPSVRASGVTLDASPLMLALRGSRALHGVVVSALEVRVPLQAPASEQLIERLLARKTEQEQNASATREAPDVRVDRLGLELSDQQGELVRVSAGRLRMDQAGAQLELEHVRVGGPPDSALELERTVLQATRGLKGLQLQRMSVAQAHLRLAEPQPSAQQASPKTDDDVDVAPAQPARPGLRQRLLALGARPQASAQPAVATTASAAQRKPALWLERLTDDAQLTLAAASVDTGPAAAPILQGLHASMAMQRGHALSFAGSGKAQGQGALSWDLVLRPEEMRADGQVELRALSLGLLAPFLPAVPWYEPAQGRVDAELVIKTDSAGAVAFSGDVSLHGAGLSSPRIAADPVKNIDVSLRGKGRFLPFSHRLEVSQAEVGLRGAALNVTGAVEWSADHYLFDIDAVLPPTPCNKAVGAIPEDLLGEMALASWQGKLAGHLRLLLDSRELDKTELVIAPVDHCEFVTVPALADLRRFRMPFVQSVLEPDGTLFEMETGPGTAEWTFLEDISPFFVHAVLAHEDAGFFSHHGFSQRHIRDALVRNLKEGRYVVGASTITMQLVKNVFLHREKTLARKIQEVLLTWWIERVMEKRDIIELYLNVIEYGPSVYGIRNAARHYFNRLPSQLSPAEAVFLATILPNPKHYHSFFERRALSAGWIDQMHKMLARTRERGWYSPEAVEYGLAELKDFRFVPEGTIVAARQIPGHAAPLPYMQSFSGQPRWGDALETELPAGGEDGGFEPAPRPKTGAKAPQKPTPGPAPKAPPPRAQAQRAPAH
jgi:hypothetical protein